MRASIGNPVVLKGNGHVGKYLNQSMACANAHKNLCIRMAWSLWPCFNRGNRQSREGFVGVDVSFAVPVAFVHEVHIRCIREPSGACSDLRAPADCQVQLQVRHLSQKAGPNVGSIFRFRSQGGFALSSNWPFFQVGMKDTPRTACSFFNCALSGSMLFS